MITGSASAHELKPAIADILLQHNPDSTNFTAKARIRLNLESLMANIGTEHDDTRESPNSEHYEQLRAMTPQQLSDDFERFRESFVDSVVILSDSGRRVPVLVNGIEILAQENPELPRDTLLDLEFEFVPDETDFSWQWSDSYGEIIVRTESRSEQLDYAALLSAGQQSDRIKLGEVTQLSVLSTLMRYTVVGFQHILPKGLDHILFIIGLFLLSPLWKPLLLQVTAFTIAHSITLALSTLNILTVPSAVVEPLIALSIVLVCIENICVRELHKRRIVLVFLFGLLHGMGFASVLAEVGLQQGQFLWALLAFNIGVELGQLLIIVICLLAVGLWHRDKAWYRPWFSIPLSVLLGLIGLYWFIERVLPFSPITI